MKRARCIGIGILLALTPAVSALDPDSLVRSLWPAAAAITGILLAGHAAIGLAIGVAAAALLLAGHPVAALRETFAIHLFPAMQGPWRIGALVFTLALGAFAAVLERSGGFESLLHRLLEDGKNGERRLLGGVFGVGLLCFFDGLASSLLTGRIARPLVDRAAISRERLAWVVDSTGSPIACVAFVSTWIATQLSLIEQGLENAPFAVEPYALFFRSIPANAYCLLALVLVPLAIATGYQPAAMLQYPPRPPADPPPGTGQSPARVVLVPLAVLITAILASFPLLSSPVPDVLSLEGWKQAFSGDSGPYALVLGSVIGLASALALFPTGRQADARKAAIRGAGSLLPALIVLVLAWTLGSQFKALGTIDHIAALLADGISVSWLPLAIFLTGSAMAFTTGSSWGTMGLLMPLALPATLAASSALPPAEAQQLAVMVIGAVFGGATLGDHCSPFSDTTIVSALASGCNTLDHVISQLPFAAMAAACACAAYALMAVGLPPWLATTTAALALTGWVLILRRHSTPKVARHRRGHSPMNCQSKD